MRELEAEILRELRQVTGKPKLRQKDIAEWSTGEVVGSRSMTEAEKQVPIDFVGPPPGEGGAKKEGGEA